jgi:hypothetical protein
MKLSQEELRRFEAVRKSLDIENNREDLELAMLESIDDFDDDTIRRMFLVAFEKEKPN